MTTEDCQDEPVNEPWRRFENGPHAITCLVCGRYIGRRRPFLSNASTGESRHIVCVPEALRPPRVSETGEST